MKKLLLIVLVLLGCGNPYNPFGRRNKPQQPQTNLHDLLDAKRQDYLTMAVLRAQTLTWSWPEIDGDSFLFTCLYDASGGASDYTLALNPNGRPMRNPTVTVAESNTPWSKDMETGFLWCIYTDPTPSRALSALQAHISYGRANLWDMCGAAAGWNISEVDRLSECVMTPGLEATEYVLLKHLGGACDARCEAAQIDPLGADIPEDGSETGQHLAVLHRGLRGFLLGGLSNLELTALQTDSQEEPNNALYSCMYHRFSDGNVNQAAELLLDESKFPSTSLPTNIDYCTPYLYNRDELENGAESSNWLPCPANPEPDQVRGLDLLLAAHCVLDP